MTGAGALVSLAFHEKKIHVYPVITNASNVDGNFSLLQRNLDKAGDLLEEAGQCSGGTSLKDLAKSLKTHLRGFSDRLEDTRERLEDTSRCFYLLDRVSSRFFFFSASAFVWRLYAKWRVRRGGGRSSSDYNASMAE